MENKLPRIGIFLCECGGNISDVINITTIIDQIKNWDNVVVAEQNKYLCSQPAQEMIIKTIKELNVDRVIVACCTPRMHLTTFKNVLDIAGLNQYMLEFVNIREHCSWVHGPQSSLAATKKAINLIRGSYERSRELEPLETISEKCSRDILVIGGGIAGITSALQLGDLDFKVHLVERNPSIGGNMSKLTKVFPTLDCAQCILAPKMAEIGRNLNVNLLTYSEVLDITGRPGNFNVKILKKPRYVIKECTSCNDCVDVCPVIVPDEFEEGMAVRHAIYVPFPQAVPSTYIIDRDLCFKSDTLACDKCFQACTRQAINFEQQPETIDLHVGAIIMATGYELYDAKRLVNYGYGIYDNVISMMELERLTSASGPTGGNVTMTGSNVKKIAILLCAGSRDKNHIPYCSRICCMYAMKQAYVLKKMLSIDVHIYYTDIRATGKDYEELYWRNQESGVIFTRGKVADIWKTKNNRLNVIVEDTLTGNISEEEFDLVALATPMIPSSGLKDLASKIKLSLGEDGFIQERHPKLDPVDSLITGIFACGCALSPKDVRDTVSDALAAAAKASLFLKSEYITTSPEKAFVIAELCDGCGICIQTCPSNAITIQEGKATIDLFMCTGCSACIPVCPKESIDFKNSTTRQIIAQLRGVLMDKEHDEVRIIAFVDKNVGYTGMDFLGLARVDYPENIRIVSIPSTAILGLKHLLYAFMFGADGILMIEGQQDIDEEFTRKRMLEMSHSLAEFGIKRMRIRYSYVPLPVYKKAADLFTRFTERIKKFGPFSNEKRNVIKQKVLS